MTSYTGWLTELLLWAIVFISHVEGSFSHMLTDQLNTNCFATGVAIHPDTNLLQNVVPRALPDAPDGYAPRRVPCPQDGARIRVASDLSPQERDWLQKRRKNTIAPMKEFLSRVNITGFDSSKYMDQISGNIENLPNIGI